MQYVSWGHVWCSHVWKEPGPAPAAKKEKKRPMKDASDADSVHLPSTDMVVMCLLFYFQDVPLKQKPKKVKTKEKKPVVDSDSV